MYLNDTPHVRAIVNTFLAVQFLLSSEKLGAISTGNRSRPFPLSSES